MRLSIVSLMTIGALASCGDDNSTSTPDARPIDAPPDAAPEFKGFKADEAGEARLEWVNFVNGNAGIRVTNFILKSPGTPAFHELLAFKGCTDLDKAQGKWPTAQSADAVYATTGPVLYSGGPMTFTAAPNTMDGKDIIGRNHPGGKYTFFFGGPTVNNAAMYLTDKTSYDVTFTGSPDMPAQIFDDVLWMPSNYALTNPPFGSYALAADMDHSFEHTVSPQTGLPADREVLSVVGFLGPNGLSSFCVEPEAASGTTRVTVPAAFTNIVRAKYPTGGLFVRQTLTHVVRELVDHNGPTGRRIDFVTVWCNLAPFTVP